MTYAARLARLENRAAELSRSNHTKDAADFRSRIVAMANQFDDLDFHIPALERCARFSKAMELAWVMRFGTVDEFQSALDEAVAYAKAAAK